MRYLTDEDVYITLTDVYHHRTEIQHRALIDAINMVPTANMIEQKRGKWIKTKGLYKCSYCNKSWTAWWAGAVPIEQMKEEMPYCPMCGSYNGEESDNAEIC